MIILRIGQTDNLVLLGSREGLLSTSMTWYRISGYSVHSLSNVGTGT